MTSERAPELSSYRVTLFFGPEPVEEKPGVLACVFNVKKRSWKAGIQVAVEIDRDHLARLGQEVRLDDRLTEALTSLEAKDRRAYQARADDLFAQAVAWCKLDLRLQTGLTQDNQRILATDFLSELDQSVVTRTGYVVAYVLNELDIAPDYPSHSSR